MTFQQFDEIVTSRCEKIKSILASKAKEYARGDRLHNFKVAARISDSTPERALKGMFMKHLVSVLDIIDELDSGCEPNEYLINEKIGDSVNYLILLEALLIERIENGKV